MNLLGDIICGRINFRNSDFLSVTGVGRVELSQLFVFGRKTSESVSWRHGKEYGRHSRFAVTAPWSIKLHQDILLVVKHDIFVILRNDHRHRSLLLLRDGLGLDAGFDLAINVILDKLAHELLGKLRSCKGEFLVLHCVLDGEGWPLADLKVQVPGVCTESFCINGGKVDFALVLLSESFELSGKFGSLLGTFREDVGKRNAGLEIIVSTRLNEGSNLGNTRPCSQRMFQVLLRQQEVCLQSAQTGRWRRHQIFPQTRSSLHQSPCKVQR